jgi:CRP-like cAMP-binding protein
MRDTAKLSKAQARLELDVEGFEKTERLVAYELANMMLLLTLEVQKTYGLRAEDHQVFTLIALSTVQRFARLPTHDAAHMTRAPLPVQYASSISRRRISEVLGIPFETVRRIVKELLARGLIVERSRGALSTAGGTLEHLSKNGKNEHVTRRYITTVNTLMRLGALVMVSKD